MNAKGNFPYDQLKNEDLLLKVLINNNFHIEGMLSILV
ncbi:hypothetical protein IMAU80006_03191 [Lactiplantibacillus plantarum]|jgi:hypothetical protein|nr:hypothetical protein [Lactiplantibacillus plantarum]